MKRAVILFVFLLFLIPSVLSIRLMPPSLELPYEPGTVHKISFSVNDLKNNGVEIGTGGDFSRSIVALTDPTTCKDSCNLEFEVTIPEFPADAPGKKESYITFREVPPSSYGLPAVSAVGQIRVPITVYAPYPTKFVLVEVGTRDNKRRFQLGEKVFFVTQVSSYGKETIETVKGNMEIRSEKGDLVTTVPLTTQSQLEYSSTANLYAEWQTADTLSRGTYFYNAVVDYDGNTASHSRALELGDQIVEVRKIDPDQLVSGSINKVDVVLYNSWSSNLVTSVQATITSPQEEVVATTTSSTIEVPTGDIARVPLFLDLETVSPGEYNLKLTTLFGEGRTYTQDFKLKVNEKPIASVNKSPQQGLPNEQENSLLVPLILGIVIVVALGLLILLLVKKHKNGPSRPKDEF
ncbi:hypothetical protein HYV86_07920 [Candidatus Woesearchaeota archaeon]|nr:hypothetical protein [Candidatus Woesearchaeota archaeon]